MIGLSTDLVTWMFGLITLTAAVSSSVTGFPSESLPVDVALLVVSAVSALEQVYVHSSPGLSTPAVPVSPVGADSGLQVSSPVLMFVSGSSPVFLTLTV